MSPSYCCGNRDSLLEQGVSAVVHCWLNYEMEDGLEEVEHVCKHKTTGFETSIHVLTHYMYIMVNVLLREKKFKGHKNYKSLNQEVLIKCFTDTK